MPDWAIIVLILVGCAIIFAILKAVFTKKEDIPSPSVYVPKQRSPVYSSEDTDTDGSEDYIEDDEEEEVEEEEEYQEDMTDKWLSENDVYDDSYESLLLQYFGLEDPIPVKNITVNHDVNEITFTFVFPKTEVEKEIVLDKENVEFNIIDSDSGDAKITLGFEQDIWNDTPDYNCEEELPIDQMDWDYVVSDITSMVVDVTQEQYDMLFPTVSLFPTDSI